MDNTAGARDVVGLHAILPTQAFDKAVAVLLPPDGQQIPQTPKTLPPSPVAAMMRVGSTEHGLGWIRKLGDVLNTPSQVHRRADISTAIRSVPLETYHGLQRGGNGGKGRGDSKRLGDCCYPCLVGSK